MCFAFFSISLPSFRAKDCSIKTLFLTITKRAVVKLDGITTTLIYRMIPHNSAKLLKLRFVLYRTDLYLLSCLKLTVKTKGSVATAAFREDNKSADTKQVFCFNMY